MTIKKLIKLLYDAQDKIKAQGGNPATATVSIEARDYDDETYFEPDFDLFLDGKNNVGLSPKR